MAVAGSPSVWELEERAASEMCPWNPHQPWLGRCQRAARERWELLFRGMLTSPHAQLPIASLFPSVLLSRLNACI